MAHDIAFRRKLAADFMQAVNTPDPKGWTEHRCALADSAGNIIGVMPVQGWTMAGATEVANMLGLTIVNHVEVTVTLRAAED